MHLMRSLPALVLSVSLTMAHAQSSSTPTVAPGFSGVQQWQTALADDDVAALAQLYATAPQGRDAFRANKLELDFWRQQMQDHAATPPRILSQQIAPGQGGYDATLVVQLTLATARGPRPRYVVEQQSWRRQSAGWRIATASHSELLKMRPLEKLRRIYDEQADAHAAIADAIAQATHSRRRVILIFGGNWCPDCQVLDQAMHEPTLAPLVERNFFVVHIDIGHGEHRLNRDLAERYKIPLDKGVPALAVLNSDGTLLFAQRNGEWEAARTMDPDDIQDFLEKWKP